MTIRGTLPVLNAGSSNISDRVAGMTVVTGPIRMVPVLVTVMPHEPLPRDVGGRESRPIRWFPLPASRSPVAESNAVCGARTRRKRIRTRRQPPLPPDAPAAHT